MGYERTNIQGYYRQLQDNKVAIGNFQCHNIERDCESCKGLDGVEVVEFIQESLIMQYIGGSTRTMAKPDPL